MSMLGIFGVCAKERYQKLKELISSDRQAEAEALIHEIQNELEDTQERFGAPPCSGEVFLPLFYYFKTELGVDVRSGTAAEGLAETWRAVTGDFDVIALCCQDQLLALEDTLDYNEISQYVTDFFQCDYAEAGENACKGLFSSLRKADDKTVLIWRLC